LPNVKIRVDSAEKDDIHKYIWHLYGWWPYQRSTNKPALRNYALYTVQCTDNI
jgi:hypothetical protein